MTDSRDSQSAGSDKLSREEAREILDALSAEEDGGDDPRVQEALRMGRCDPELAASWERRRREDGKISSLLREVEAPSELRERLRALVGRSKKGPASEGRQFSLLGWCAAAALLVLAAWGVSHLMRQSSRDGDKVRGSIEQEATVEEFREAMIEELRSLDGLDLQESNLDEVVRWLKAKGAPVGGSIPKVLDALDGMGCKILDWRGSEVSLICFHDRESETWHLLTIPAAVFKRLPKAELEKILIVDRRETEAWVDDGMFQLLIAGTDSN